MTNNITRFLVKREVVTVNVIFDIISPREEIVNAGVQAILLPDLIITIQ